MKIAIGVILILLGLVAALYLGLWVCFIGGIVAIIEQVKAPELNAFTVALGVARVFFATFVGTISLYAGLIPGYLMIRVR